MYMFTPYFYFFQGRNVDQVSLMIDRIEQFNKEQQNVPSNNSINSTSITISVELEKPKRVTNILRLLDKGDVVSIACRLSKYL